MAGDRRDRALLIRCPKCGSAPGFACQGKRGPRAAPHLDRAAAAPARRHVEAVRAAPAYRDGGFYSSDAWRVVRYDALRRSHGICECCGAPPARGRPLHVDHIKPRSRFPDLALELSNLQVLCSDCNLGKGNTDEIDWRRSEGAQ